MNNIRIGEKSVFSCMLDKKYARQNAVLRKCLMKLEPY
jgi:hypothetical protein